jgi:hypothetical protein
MKFMAGVRIHFTALGSLSSPTPRTEKLKSTASIFIGVKAAGAKASGLKSHFTSFLFDRNKRQAVKQYSYYSFHKHQRHGSI